MQNSDALTNAKLDLTQRDLAKLREEHQQQQQLFKTSTELTGDHLSTILSKVDRVPSMHAMVLRSDNALQTLGKFLKEIQKSPSLQRYVQVTQNQG